MNPLDLRGPEFLAFYLVWGIGVLALLRFWAAATPDLAAASGARHWTPGQYLREEDAYAVALLRGGADAAADTLLARLVATGTLQLEKRDLRLNSAAPPDLSSLSSFEREALHAAFPDPAVPCTAIEARQRAVRVMTPYLAPLREDLERQGLVPGPAERRRYRLFSRAALAAILGLGLLKLLVALARGRSNVGFLVILSILFLVVILALFRPPEQTAAGRRYLAWLRESHAGLAQMIGQDRRTGQGELALALGIYGLALLPSFHPLLSALRPVQPADAGSDSGCGGSSCSGGSSCGGGGGCGGGCGGCGG